MIGTFPAFARAPLDYRYALDAAMSIFAGKSPPRVLCNPPELMSEIRQRIPFWAETSTAPAGLWVEPLRDTWREDLQSLAGALTGGAPLVIIASRALARLLLERHSWAGKPLGFLPGGIARLQHALARAGFLIEASYGIHSALAIGLNTSSQLMERWGRSDIGDRLHLAARHHYCTSGPLAMLGTVMLLIARKEQVES
ncbi:MAG: hypothetical protein EHM33_23765 [Chloroflexi bacterium]|nr:MAG: hypothetical protein EHM33_23765 [Chloroflexota bacterium]